MRIILLLNTLLLTSCITTNNYSGDSAPENKDSKARLCKHIQTREYNPSGHEKNRKATYIRYDEFSTRQENQIKTIKELQNLIKDVPEADRATIIKSFLAKISEKQSKGGSRDYCSIKWTEKRKP